MITVPRQHGRSSNGNKFLSQIWTPGTIVDITKQQKIIQDQRQSDITARKTLYDFVHHLRQVTESKHARTFIVPLPNSDVLGPEK